MSSVGKNYYSILRLQPLCSAEDIITQYHKLAKECHPDRFRNQSIDIRNQKEQEMAEINDAYHVLSNEHSRRKYDEEQRQDSSSSSSSSLSAASCFSSSSASLISSSSSSIAYYYPLPKAPNPSTYTCMLSLCEYFKGTQKYVSMQTETVCRYCDGKGVHAPYMKEACSQCKQDPTRPCLYCKGSREQIPLPGVCLTCMGQGFTTSVKFKMLQIPSQSPLVLTDMKKAIQLSVDFQWKSWIFFQQDSTLCTSLPSNAFDEKGEMIIQHPDSTWMRIKIRCPELIEEKKQALIYYKTVPMPGCLKSFYLERDSRLSPLVFSSYYADAIHDINNTRVLQTIWIERVSSIDSLPVSLRQQEIPSGKEAETCKTQ